MNYYIDPKPGSEWLSNCRPTAHKFGQQINDKLNTRVESGHMYPPPKDPNAVVMFCVAKWDELGKPKFVTDYHLMNLGLYK